MTILLHYYFFISNTNLFYLAAQCVTDELYNLQSKDDYLIGAGKLYATINDPRDSHAQFSNVNIDIPTSILPINRLYLLYFSLPTSMFTLNINYQEELFKM